MLTTKTYVGFDKLAKQYSKLFEAGSKDSFFLSLPWFQNLQRTVLDPEETVEIIGVEDSDSAGSPRAALVLKTRPRYRFMSPRTIHSLANYYTSYYGIIVSASTEELPAVAKGVVEELCNRRPSWDVLNLRPVDLSAPGLIGFEHALKQAGILTQSYFCFGNWYLSVEGRSFSEYLKDLPSRVRVNVPRHRRRLEKSARVRMRIYTGSKYLDSAISDYETIYNSSWRVPEAYPNFIRGLIRTAAEQEWLRLGMLYVDDEPAAAQIWIVHGGIASIYKLGYAEKFVKLSVGSILTAHMMEYALDADKVKEVDYLTGDDEYKADWMSARRERWGLMAFNSTTLWGNLGSIRHIGGKRIKAVWDSLAKNVGDAYRARIRNI